MRCSQRHTAVPAVVHLFNTALHAEDLTQFPFDTQKCLFHIGSWNDHGHEIRFSPGALDLSYNWSPNQQYKVEPLGMWAESKFYPCCDEPWPELLASVSLQRHADFYIYNLIFPTIAVTYLGTLQFFIPTSGAAVDRMGLPAALLLTLIAITFLVSEDMPKTAKETSLTTFNFGNLLWLTVSMLESSFVLFLATLTQTKTSSPFLRALMDLLEEEERGLHSVVLDVLSISLFTKGAQALFFQRNSEGREAAEEGQEEQQGQAGQATAGSEPITTDGEESNMETHAKDIKGLLTRLVEKEKPQGAQVTMEECGLFLDMMCRVLYPCSYTIFIATVFVQ